MRTRQNKAIARELTLHGDITVLKLRVAELERRIRAARAEVMLTVEAQRSGSHRRLERLEAVLDGRKPLPKRSKR